ncbi:hypothetical protein IHE44_0012530 [Lamprotornis superbus]|uniref:Uncharacterized protein n=3 Tax=Tetrapoda TaxID=32523 RepID=A0A835P3X2_9PASS|nr:hypothetical protein IHE44_0012530 [Lamprotornis superbus]
MCMKSNLVFYVTFNKKTKTKRLERYTSEKKQRRQNYQSISCRKDVLYVASAVLGRTKRASLTEYMLVDEVKSLQLHLLVLRGWQLSGDGVQGVLGPPGTPGSQDLSQPSPEPGSQGHRDSPGPGNRDRPGCTHGWTVKGCRGLETSPAGITGLGADGPGGWKDVLGCGQELNSLLEIVLCSSFQYSSVVIVSVFLRQRAVYPETIVTAFDMSLAKRRRSKGIQSEETISTLIKQETSGYCWMSTNNTGNAAEQKLDVRTSTMEMNHKSNRFEKHMERGEQRPEMLTQRMQRLWKSHHKEIEYVFSFLMSHSCLENRKMPDLLNQKFQISGDGGWHLGVVCAVVGSPSTCAALQRQLLPCTAKNCQAEEQRGHNALMMSPVIFIIYISSKLLRYLQSLGWRVVGRSGGGTKTTKKEKNKPDDLKYITNIHTAIMGFQGTVGKEEMSECLSYSCAKSQLAAGTCEIVTLDRDSSQPRRTIARQTARCACKKGQIAGTTRARPACVDVTSGISRSVAWVKKKSGASGGRCKRSCSKKSQVPLYNALLPLLALPRLAHNPPLILLECSRVHPTAASAADHNTNKGSKAAEVIQPNASHLTFARVFFGISRRYKETTKGGESFQGILLQMRSKALTLMIDQDESGSPSPAIKLPVIKWEQRASKDKLLCGSSNPVDFPAQPLISSPVSNNVGQSLGQSKMTGMVKKAISAVHRLVKAGIVAEALELVLVSITESRQYPFTLFTFGVRENLGQMLCICVLPMYWKMETAKEQDDAMANSKLCDDLCTIKCHHHVTAAIRTLTPDLESTKSNEGHSRTTQLNACPLDTPRIIKTKQWCEMLPCLEGEGCDLLINKSGWTCTQPGGRIKTTTCHLPAQAGFRIINCPRHCALLCVWLEESSSLRMQPRNCSSCHGTLASAIPNLTPDWSDQAILVQKPFGTTTDVADPSIINHSCPYNALPTELDTKVLNLISSFRCIVALVEELSFQQSLVGIEIYFVSSLEIRLYIFRGFDMKEFKKDYCRNLITTEPPAKIAQKQSRESDGDLAKEFRSNMLHIMPNLKLEDEHRLINSVCVYVQHGEKERNGGKQNKFSGVTMGVLINETDRFVSSQNIEESNPPLHCQECSSVSVALYGAQSQALVLSKQDVEFSNRTHEAIKDIFRQEEYKNKDITVYKDSNEYIKSERVSYFRVYVLASPSWLPAVASKDCWSPESPESERDSALSKDILISLCIIVLLVISIVSESFLTVWTALSFLAYIQMHSNASINSIAVTMIPFPWGYNSQGYHAIQATIQENGLARGNDITVKHMTWGCPGFARPFPWRHWHSSGSGKRGNRPLDLRQELKAAQPSSGQARGKKFGLEWTTRKEKKNPTNNPKTNSKNKPNPAISQEMEDYLRPENALGTTDQERITQQLNNLLNIGPSPIGNETMEHFPEPGPDRIVAHGKQNPTTITARSAAAEQAAQ